jgi:hypothetical protein
MHSGKVILITGGQVSRALRPWPRCCGAVEGRRSNARFFVGESRRCADNGCKCLHYLDESLHRAMTGVHGVFCVPPLVTSFMAAVLSTVFRLRLTKV